MKLQSAYIYFVNGSTAQSATIEDVKAKFTRYMDMTAKTGQQLGWSYQEAAFPYTIEERPEGKESWFLLKGKDPSMYKSIVVGVGSANEDGTEKHYIQISLPEAATNGDMNKANEYCRYLARDYKAELHLFNKRVQYFQPRKP
ncbi:MULTISPECIES: DUF1885 family protein [Brevibacillus]|uniref:DUF1885 domain-containing protein n=1 Tax=Brevibacillus parabrevis TaxID=54914 RepID=A0A4Y3PJZ4_BREPA|nr:MULTISPECIES: DUF1885 family protein [Brevibacillus]NRQ54637.1 DUF1885 family protein [Brevibacillus sp. HD1.4A]MBU8711729.1 DUF1885 family protein [Brevibacillus parabrevis]MDH6349642.1 hypothetical protein [Brevibacillus sp. 1238]MDR4999097.1 DUF1885 family protein [Brevibacillus parabrevis]MED2254346.1 DUF1885 family protein [Brevibacillus parabrevis]